MTTKPDHLIFDLFGTLVFFDNARVPKVRVGDALVPMTIADLAERVEGVAPGVDLPTFFRELRRIGAALAEKKRREGIEIPSSCRFEQTLLALGVSPEDAASVGKQMAASHMDSLARAVVCPPDRRALLQSLCGGYALGLLSNFDDGATARRVIGEAGLEAYFREIVISDEEGLRKPNRQLFERTCRRLGSNPSTSLYIGDTLVEDIEGATNAGLSAIWIHPHADAVSPAVAVMSDVAGLPEWLAKL